MENNNSAKQTSSHQQYGENYYAPPPMFQNNGDLESNSTQSSNYYQPPQIGSDAYIAQQASKMDQAGMYQPIFPASDKQDKQKRDYIVYYHHPELPEENKPVDPLYNKIYGENGGGNSGNNFNYKNMCQCHCGNCYDCQVRRKVEEQKRREQEECECLLNCFCQCLVGICLGLCEAAIENR